MLSKKHIVLEQESLDSTRKRKYLSSIALGLEPSISLTDAIEESKPLEDILLDLVHLRQVGDIEKHHTLYKVIDFDTLKEYLEKRDDLHCYQVSSASLPD